MNNLATITILLIAMFGGIVFAEEPVKEPDAWNNLCLPRLRRSNDIRGAIFQ